MAGTTQGVHPCYANQFSIDITGGDGTTEANLKPIADMETYSVAINGTVEEWSPYDTEGWLRRMVTGKNIVITVNGKRNIGDDGNDYIESIATKIGQDCETTFVWNFPSGAKLVMPCVINVTEWEAADATNVAPLAFEAQSNGMPTFTPA